MILLIDNYDSFTFNLYQFIGEFDTDIKVFRNNHINIDDVLSLNPDKIIISPGPKTPNEAGNCISIIKGITHIPILGICLGHQAIAESYGAIITNAKKLCHGKSANVFHNNDLLFQGIASPLVAARYHSLAIKDDSLPECFSVIAKTSDGEIMGIKHKQYTVYGLQFHPESILTPKGKKIIENFILFKNNSIAYR